ncbi:MAG TPA: hypothetical protein VFO60_02210 [Candidatus Dormibacteraeota bacterium]|nr:hypothetical protein [Candidatus Dormibacteraeota bacterium]
MTETEGQDAGTLHGSAAAFNAAGSPRGSSARSIDGTAPLAVRRSYLRRRRHRRARRAFVIALAIATLTTLLICVVGVATLSVQNHV